MPPPPKPAAPAKSAAAAKPVAPASAKPGPTAPATKSATTIPKRKQTPGTDSSQPHKLVTLEQIAAKFRALVDHKLDSLPRYQSACACLLDPPAYLLPVLKLA